MYKWRELRVDIGSTLFRSAAEYGSSIGPGEDLESFVVYIVDWEGDRLADLGGEVTGFRVWLDGCELYSVGEMGRLEVQDSLFGVAAVNG